ncbi:unnamed protein product [Polarella glacialis]|uniref:Kinesin-like protein n=1 Tax=Polarella glacialis TaxID=89957 RepID=A0A813JWU4_POLGL|nr:unnamed protein product [Polarella glacialis]
MRVSKHTSLKKLWISRGNSKHCLVECEVHVAENHRFLAPRLDQAREARNSWRARGLLLEEELEESQKRGAGAAVSLLRGVGDEFSGSPQAFTCAPRPISAHRLPQSSSSSSAASGEIVDKAPALEDTVKSAAAPRGGIAVDVDFGPRTKGLPPGLAARLAKDEDRPSDINAGSRAESRPGAGFAMDVDLGPKSKGPPPAVAARFAQRELPVSLGLPRGGVAIDVDMGRKSTKGPPPALAARLAKRGARALAVPETADQSEPTSAESSATRGGVVLDIDFSGVAKSRGPPAALAARLSKTAGAAARRGPLPCSGKRVASVASFVQAEKPIEHFANHDELEFGEDAEGFLMKTATTAAVRQFCCNLHGLSPDEVRQLLAWRLALRHEQLTGKPPSPEELEDLCREEAQEVVGSQANGREASAAPVASDQGAVLTQAVKGLANVMDKLVGDKATDEDATLLEDLEKQMEELKTALKEPGLSSAKTCLLKKQLSQRRAEKCRAERAVRQGRSAKLEVKGSSEEIRAVLSSLPTASRVAKHAAPDGSGPPRFSGEATPPGSPRTAGGVKATSLPPGLSAGEAPPSAGSVELVLAVLLHPETLAAAGFCAVGYVGQLSRVFKAIALDGSDKGFGDTAWRVACQALAVERALWCPAPRREARENFGYWKKLFVHQLWPSRKKWGSGRDEPQRQQRKLGDLGVGADEEPAARDFAIQVSVRFKPGATTQSKLLVPLHQKLLLERAKRDVDSAQGLKLGDKEPPEFLDGLLGQLMLDPVKLPGSGKVCDRKVIEGEIRVRGPTDPFDGSPLHVEMLEPQEELRQRIAAWRAERRQEAADGGEKHKLGEEEVMELISRLGGDLDPEVVEAVLEAERLRAAGRSTLRGVLAGERREKKDGDEEAEENDDGLSARPEWTIDETTAEAEGLLAVPAAGPRNVSAVTAESAEEEMGEAPKREGPKVLAVCPPTRVAMYHPGVGVRPFVFARVFDDRGSQEEVYDQACQGSVCAALNGFNACMLVYGQTGAGKTHTMFGQSVAMGGNAGAVVSTTSGCVIRAMRDLFDAANELQAAGVQMCITAQYVQIYQDKASCLQTGESVALREASPGAPVLLQGAAISTLSGLMDACDLIAKGEERKRYAETAMNNRSSRAHSVMVLKISQTRGDLEITSQLHLVDLAGSERVKKSRAQGGRLVEAVGINSSLMVLGQCIAARVEARPHVPYYESRLTLLLRSALGGDSRTNVVICCHRDDTHGDETLQALSFGERCSLVTNRAQAAMASSLGDAMAAVDSALEECRSQIKGLEQRGKGSLPACARLKSRAAALQQKRREIAERTAGTKAASEHPSEQVTD